MCNEDVKLTVDRAAGLRQQQALRRMQRREHELSTASIGASASIALRKAKVQALAAASERLAADLHRSTVSRAQTPSVTAFSRGDLLTTVDAAPRAAASLPGTPQAQGSQPAGLRQGGSPFPLTTEVVDAVPLEALDQKPWLFPKCDAQALRDPYLRRYGLHRNDTHLMSHIVRSQVSRINFTHQDDVNFDFQGFSKYS
jgi:hypothetical protein